MMQPHIPPITWRPSKPQHTEMFRFARWVTTERGVDLGTLTDDDEVAEPLYRRLHAWSVRELVAFWDAVREYFGVLGDDFDTPALTEATMPDATWYPHATLNYAENILERTRASIDQDATAIFTIDEENNTETISWYYLRTRVHGLAEQLRELGVQAGDRVAAVWPNNAEAIIGLLAAATIGAVWTINSPDLASTATLSQLPHHDPKILITTTRDN